MRTLAKAEEVFLRELFAVFETMDVCYAVLRNYDTLPTSLNGSDLDILVHPDDAGKAKAAIGQGIARSGGAVLGYVDTANFIKIFSLGKSIGLDPMQWWGARLDISLDLQYAGAAQLIDIEILRKRICRHNGIRVLDRQLAALLGVIKELLHNDMLPARYIDSARRAVEENWAEICLDLAPVGKSALDQLRDLCLSDPQSPEIKAKAAHLRRTLLWTACVRAPMAFCSGVLGFQWSKVKRIFRPSGLVIAVLGTDGAGKSTIIHAIDPVLAAATHGALFVKHLRPGLLPPLARLKGKKAPQDGPMIDPHGSSPSGAIGSFCRLVYLLIDYVVGYWIIIRPIIAKRPAVVLFDRYAYDMAIDPRRFRINLPGWLLRSFLRLAPRPDLIFCLHGDPGVIAGRKRELPMSEVKRQTHALLDFAAKESRAIVVSTDGTVEQARDQVLTALLEFCAQRTATGARHGP
jgi:thymidylate kinase